MRRQGMSALVIGMFLLGGALGGAARAEKDPFCVKAKADLRGKVYTAKVPLYDTEIAQDSIMKVERDEEEIREGAEAVIRGVSCRPKKVKMKLEPNGPGEDVDIYFWLSAAERLEDDARERLEKMMTYVFEMEGDEDEGSGDDSGDGR